MLNQLISLYSPAYPRALIYLLKKAGYNQKTYLKLVWQTKDFSKVARESKSILSRKAKSLLYFMWLCIALEIVAGLVLIYLGIASKLAGGIFFGISLIILTPFIVSHLILIPLTLRRWYTAVPSKV